MSIKSTYFVAVLVVIVAVGAAETWSGNVMPPGNKWWMNYTIDTTASRFQATVWCKTKGWLAMGLSNDGPSGHAKTDSMIAFMNNGTKVIHDQYAAGPVQPKLDVTLGGKENLKLLDMGSDADSMWVSFWRDLDTKDGDRDVVIMNKNVYVAWACGNDVPVVQSDGTLTYNIHQEGWFGALQTNLFGSTTPGSSSTAKPSGGSTTTAPTVAKSSAASAMLSWPLLAVLAAALPAFF